MAYYASGKGSGMMVRYYRFDRIQPLLQPIYGTTCVYITTIRKSIQWFSFQRSSVGTRRKGVALSCYILPFQGFTQNAEKQFGKVEKC